MSDLKLPFYSTLLGREATSQDLAKAVPRERIGSIYAGLVFLAKNVNLSSKFVGSHIWSGFPLVFWTSFKPFRLENAKVHFSLHLPIAGRLLGGSCEQCCALHCWNGSNGGSQVSRSLPGNRPLWDNGYRAVRKFFRNDWMTRMNPHKTSENSEKGDSQVFSFGMQGLCD